MQTIFKIVLSSEPGSIICYRVSAEIGSGIIFGYQSHPPKR